MINFDILKSTSDSLWKLCHLCHKSCKTEKEKSKFISLFSCTDLLWRHYSHSSRDGHFCLFFVQCPTYCQVLCNNFAFGNILRQHRQTNKKQQNPTVSHSHLLLNMVPKVSSGNAACPNVQKFWLHHLCFSLIPKTGEWLCPMTKSSEFLNPYCKTFTSLSHKSLFVLLHRGAVA